MFSGIVEATAQVVAIEHDRDNIHFTLRCPFASELHIAVADIIRDEHLVENAARVGEHIMRNIPQSPLIREVRGKGLMIGIEFSRPAVDIRQTLLKEKHIFTGAAGSDIIRLLPPLVLTENDADIFLSSLKELI